MCVLLVLEAICVSINSSASSIAAVVRIFGFDACSTWGWMGTMWIYPLKIRTKGTALATAADFLSNFLVAESTPPALKNVTHETYIIFAVLNIVNMIIAWCFNQETSGQTLESTDRLFVSDWKDETLNGDKTYIFRRAQWSVVRRARVAAKEEWLRKRNTGSDGEDGALGGKRG